MLLTLNQLLHLNSLNLFYYGKSALSLKRLYYLIPFFGKKFDIIHCHFGSNGIIGVYLKGMGINSRFITTFHGYDMSTFILNHGKDIYKNLFSKGDLFMPISEYGKEKLVKMGCEEGKIILHRMGINLDDFKFREGKPAEIIKILSVGRLVEKKGHEYAIKAIAKIISKHKNIIYQIAGDGALGDKLESLVSERGLDDCVKFLGIVKHDEVFKLYQEAHIVILPSVTADNSDQEGIPVVLMEAQAVGLPVISTFHSGIPEVVVDGQSGFLVPERNVDTLAEKLEYLIEHPEIWSEMGRAGRKFVGEYYDIKKLNQQLVKIYQNLIKERK